MRQQLAGVVGMAVLTAGIVVDGGEEVVSDGSVTIRGGGRYASGSIPTD